MDEINHLIEESTQSTRTRHNTTWYSPKEGDIKREVLTRLIIWDDSFYKDGPEEPESAEAEPGGYIVFDIYDKLLYDRIFEYFNLQKNPSFLLESIEIKLYKKSYVTEWSFPKGTIRSYHRWFCNKHLSEHNKFGRISFTINDKDLFDKFKAYVLKFEP